LLQISSLGAFMHALCVSYRLSW